MGAELVVEQPIAAERSAVYAAWTTADGLARWWWPHIPDTTYEVDERVGGRYEIRSDAAGIGARGEFLELDEPTLIRMTWNWMNDGVSEVEEHVHVAFAPTQDGTLVTLTHHLADIAGDGADLRQGWEDVLARLAQTTQQVAADAELALAAARAYCVVIDQRREMDLEAFLVAVHRAVSGLYATVLALPDIEPSDTEYADGWSLDDWSALYADLQDVLGPIDRYREIYDPYEDESESPVVASLADAIADVYGSAVKAIRVADAATDIDAAFELQLAFSIDGGHHAVDVMRAIQAHRFESRSG